MSNVNTLNDSEINQKKSSGLSRLSQVLALCTILSITNPAEVKASNITDECLQNVEVVQSSDIIRNIQRRIWISVPNEYSQKLKNFISTNRIMKDSGSAKFTEDFIVKEMQTNRWISKQNQLLFIRAHIYNEITNTYLYDWTDGNNSRLNEYGSVMNIAENCWKKYRNAYIAYTKQRSANADRMSADARQNRINTTYRWLQDMINFYNIYKKNPNNVKPEEIRQAKEHSKRIIQNCKDFWINYKAKLSTEVRRFYGID